MISGVPLALTFRFDASAINQQIQGADSTAIRQAHTLRLLTTAQCAEIRYGPVQPNQLQQAFNKACRLPRRKPEQHFQCQTRLDRHIAKLLLRTALAARERNSADLGIKANRQRSASLQRGII